MKNKKISSTATLIAKTQVLLSHDSNLSFLVPKEAVKASLWFIEESTGSKTFGDYVVKSKLYKFILSAIERITVPGIILHYAARKRFIENVVRESISKGINQVVIVAGGLDTLAFRLHKEFKDVNFVELDHPATQVIKTNTFSKKKIKMDNYHLVPVDLTKRSLSEVLKSSAVFDSKIPSLFIAEGITMYLTEKEVNTFFQSIYEISSNDSEIVFTYKESIKDKNKFHLGTKLADLWLWLKKEPYKWQLDNNKLEDFLDPRGYKLKYLKKYDELQEEFRGYNKYKDIAHARENICVASINS